MDIIELKEKAYHNFSIIPSLAKENWSIGAISDITGLTYATIRTELNKIKTPLTATNS